MTSRFLHGKFVPLNEPEGNVDIFLILFRFPPPDFFRFQKVKVPQYRILSVAVVNNYFSNNIRRGAFQFSDGFETEANVFW